MGVVSEQLTKHPQKQVVRRTGPLWEGPSSDGPQGGITYSLLSRFLCCRERFRALAIEGLKPTDTFNHRLEYGTMWHLCEEALAGKQEWRSKLLDHVRALCTRYPTQQEQVDHWYNVCKVQFPIYVDYWKRHPDVLDRKPLFQEQIARTRYVLPSGRHVYLRAKLDSGDAITGRLYLQENKSKGDINEVQIKQQLASGFDLQTMLYLTILMNVQDDAFWNRSNKTWRNMPLGGIRYNVIRRPLSGGRGTIKRHEPTKKNPLGESKPAFYERLAGIINEEPGYFFMRWKVELTKESVARFRRECLDPILENLCWWYETVVEKWVTPGENHKIPPCHWRHPYGVYNVLDEGGSSDYDRYLENGSEVGLYRADDLFPELKAA